MPDILVVQEAALRLLSDESQGLGVVHAFDQKDRKDKVTLSWARFDGTHGIQVKFSGFPRIGIGVAVIGFYVIPVPLDESFQPALNEVSGAKESLSRLSVGYGLGICLHHCLAHATLWNDKSYSITAQRMAIPMKFLDRFDVQAKIGFVRFSAEDILDGINRNSHRF